MKIVLYANRLTHFVETTAYFLSRNEAANLIVVTGLRDEHGGEHPDGHDRLAGSSHIRLFNIHDTPERSDWFWISLQPNMFAANLNSRAWGRRARRIGLIREREGRPRLRSLVREAVESLPFGWNARAMLHQTFPASRGPFIHISQAHRRAPYVHPQFLLNERYRNTIFCPPMPANRRRKFRFGFMGGRTPRDRQTMLDELASYFRDLPSCAVTAEPFGEIKNAETLICWIVYGDSSTQAGVAPEQYVDLLDSIDFCLCPAGWSRWTHRVIEALIRGTIPILEEPDLYDAGLLDGVNCIRVSGGDWLAAVKRAHATTNDQLAAMRAEIGRVRESHLDLDLTALRFQKPFGLRDRRHIVQR